MEVLALVGDPHGRETGWNLVRTTEAIVMSYKDHCPIAAAHFLTNIPVTRPTRRGHQRTQHEHQRTR